MQSMQHALERCPVKGETHMHQPTAPNICNINATRHQKLRLLIIGDIVITTATLHCNRLELQAVQESSGLHTTVAGDAHKAPLKQRLQARLAYS